MNTIQKAIIQTKNAERGLKGINYPHHNQLMYDSLQLEIGRALETLSDKESNVIKLYYGLGGEMPMSLDEIGDTFDLSRERVRQIKEKGIRRLRHTSKSKILKTYLG